MSMPFPHMMTAPPLVHTFLDEVGHVGHGTLGGFLIAKLDATLAAFGDSAATQISLWERCPLHRGKKREQRQSKL